MGRRRSLAVLIGLSVLAPAPAARAADPASPAAGELAFFEREVRPLLVESCAKCHGAEKQKGGLRVDSLRALLDGGDSGPALVPGRPDESLLIEAVRHDGLAMPPSGKLPERGVATLERWVRQGAPWPAGDHATAASPGSTRPRGGLTDEDRAYWAFQPLADPEPPAVADAAADAAWARNPIDGFILARLRGEGLSPAPEADRRTLIRRLSFDLTGLPPTPEAIAAFEADNRPDAYDRLVEALLEGPRYGERWARHWLDLVRYAESDGYRQDAYRPQAWPYRDWVVAAFNRDLPYDAFLRAQLAGDELDPDSPEMRVATSYFRLGTYEFNQRDVPAQRAAILGDITDVTAEAVLGLGMGCARCHDHKFDPILQEDYFRLQAFFAPLQWRDDLVRATAAERADYRVRLAAWEAATADVRARIEAIEAPARAAGTKGAFDKFPDDMKAILLKPKAERTPLERQLAYLAERQYTEEGGKLDTHIKGKAKDEWKRLLAELSRYDGLKPKAPEPAFAATDVGPEAPPNLIPGAREPRDIAPGLLAVLRPELATLPAIQPTATSTGRRTALAAWLTRPDNPLSTRVIVNRVWQYHFGRGIVGTSSDFGRLGEAPTHPELLDWLARTFVADGWSLKALHRRIVTSATYRQASRVEPSEAALRKDPEGRLLWRYPPRRLEAEPLRDAMLAVSGELDLAAGGPAVEANVPRRSIYTKVVRNSPEEVLDTFDAPDASLSTALRNATITPTQALLLVNGPWSLARAEGFAARLRRECPDPADRVDRAYALAFGRPPQTEERADASAFLARGDADAALVDFCHVLLNANEFLHLD
jgi:mono/diheme cytochrome c family protein